MLSDTGLLKDKAYVNGDWVLAAGNAEFAVLNPADDSRIGAVPDMKAQDALLAVSAADGAQVAWAAETAAERAAFLRRWHALIVEHEQDLARLVTLEQGKPLAEALSEVRYGAAYISWYAGEALRVYGDIIPSPVSGQRSLVIRQPVGVVAAITPWNFPVAMIARKCGPALAAGCTMVLKPAEATPLSALALAELADRAGIPAGVFNVVTASHGAEVGKALTASPLVRKLSFTGSTATGKLLLKDCADTVKKVSLELGGNAPFIVFDDADIDAAVAAAVASKSRNTGQTCIAANRFYIHDSAYSDFAEKLVKAMGGLVVGNGAEDGVTQGPLINAEAVDKVIAHVNDAVEQGAEVLCGGKRLTQDGCFYEPTVLSGVTDGMLVAREETFGPVAALIRFESEAEVLTKANDTNAGLAAYIFSCDIGRVWRVAEQLEYGMVGINSSTISSETIPFGGIKESGLGREGSRYGIDEYLEMKYLCMAGI